MRREAPNSRRRWLLHMVLRALAQRPGRTGLLLAILLMASSLATALEVVSFSMGKRVAEEIRKYGANLVVLPATARLEIGSGGLHFGAVSEPAYLRQGEVEAAVAASKVMAEVSSHLRSQLAYGKAKLPVEGVDFQAIRRLFPWWTVTGQWPEAGEAIAGSELAARLGLQPGQELELSSGQARLRLRIAGVVTTGSEEDGLLFLPLADLQQTIGRPGAVSLVRLLTSACCGRPADIAAGLQPLLPGAEVKEVRQVARSSEALLDKVKLLMLLVTAVVLVSAGSSVAGTMSTTVLERSREIGLMKAIGGTRWRVVQIFSTEALLLAAIAGLGGCLAGTLIAEAVTRSVFSVSAGFFPGSLLISLAVSFFLAIFGSLGPLFSVFRLDPVRSLRGE